MTEMQGTVTVLLQPTHLFLLNAFCRLGEQLAGAADQCNECAAGLFSIRPNSTSGCQPCMDNVECLGGHNLRTSGGYHRTLETSSRVYRCKYTESCPATTETGQAACPKEFEGALCGVCVKGYYESGRRCLECPSGNIGWLLVLLLFLVVIV